MNLFGLALSNPAMWGGIFAVAVPLAVHLLTRRTPRHIIFPTIQFIKKAQASQSSVFKLRHWILFILRTLFILLLLLAFLKPVFHQGALSTGKDGKQRKVVIAIVDNSLSMAYNAQGFSPHQRAKKIAETVIEKAGDGALVNLIFAEAAPQSSFDKPTQNRFHLKRDLQKRNVTLERADIAGSLAEAVKQLNEYPKYKRELHLISDFQRANWASVEFKQIPEDVDVLFLPVGETATDNAAISGVSLQPANPVVSEPVEIVCKVSNYGPFEKTVELNLQFTDSTPLKKSVEVAAGMTASASFRIRPQKSGVFEGTLSIAEDALNADNKRYFSMHVSERIEILLVSDEPRADSAASHRYLQRALNPFANNSRGSVSVRLINSADLAPSAAARSQVIVMSGLKELPPEKINELLTYLDNGGSIITFLNTKSDAQNIEKLESQSKNNLKLPFQIGSAIHRSGGDSKEPSTISAANYDHPILKKFKESGGIAELNFERYFSTIRNKKQGQVLLQFNDGQIALAKKSKGLGNILIANFSPALTHSDLAKNSIFIPLIHEMIKNMRPQSGGTRAFDVGMACSDTIELINEENMVTVKSPDEKPVNAIIDIRNGEASVICGRTNQNGFYRVYEEDTQVSSIPVNTDPRESNLDSLDIKQLQELSQLSRKKFHAAAAIQMDNLNRLLEGAPMWHWFLLAGLLVLMCEQLFGMLWKQ